MGSICCYPILSNRHQGSTILQAQARLSAVQRLYVGFALTASFLRASYHIFAHSIGSCNSLAGLDLLRATKPGNAPRPVG